MNFYQPWQFSPLFDQKNKVEKKVFFSQQVVHMLQFFLQNGKMIKKPEKAKY